MKQPHPTQLKRQKRQHRLTTLRLCLGGSVVAAGAGLFALPASADDAERISKLEKENQELLRRLDALEGIAQKEGILPSGDAPQSMVVKALSGINISGFVTASYFYDTTTPADRKSNGYLWNTSHNSFSLNKVKLTLASAPVERSGDMWDAAFRVSMIWGEDSSLVNTGGETQGLEGLREAYVELNAPLGTGLNVKAGQLISLLNWESGDGGAVNPNFSQGYQWFFTGNGPSAGVHFSYTLTDWLEVKARLQNGMYAGAIDNNVAKTAMGSLNFKPTKDLWVNLLAFGGDESQTLSLSGGSVLAGYQVTPKLGTGFEFDYFNFDPVPGSSADLWSVGGWVWYDFTSKVGLALRAEYLDDQDAFGIKGVNFPGRPGSAVGVLDPGDPPAIPATLSPESSGYVTSVALTLNWKPVPNIKIQPEIRYDHTSFTRGFDGKKDRFTIGAGVSYLF